MRPRRLSLHSARTHRLHPLRPRPSRWIAGPDCGSTSSARSDSRTCPPTWRHRPSRQSCSCSWLCVECAPGQRSTTRCGRDGAAMETHDGASRIARGASSCPATCRRPRGATRSDSATASRATEPTSNNSRAGGSLLAGTASTTSGAPSTSSAGDPSAACQVRHSAGQIGRWTR